MSCKSPGTWKSVITLTSCKYRHARIKRKQKNAATRLSILSFLLTQSLCLWLTKITHERSPGKQRSFEDIPTQEETANAWSVALLGSAALSVFLPLSLAKPTNLLALPFRFNDELVLRIVGHSYECILGQLDSYTSGSQIPMHPSEPPQIYGFARDTECYSISVLLHLVKF